MFVFQHYQQTFQQRVEKLFIPDIFYNIVNDRFGMRILFNNFLYLLNRINDRGVVSSAEFIADSGLRHLGYFPYYIDRYLTGDR